MGNQIDCKYVCQEPEINEDHFFINSYSDRQGSPMKVSYDAHRGVKPSPNFAKAVGQVLTMNKKVSQVYMAQSNKLEDNNSSNDLIGVKLQPYYIFSLFAYYDGEWMNGNIHGRGILYFDNGGLLQATFKEGLINCSNALFISPNGSFYRGKVHNQKINGYGIFKSLDFKYKGASRTNKITKQYQEVQNIIFNRHHRFIARQQLLELQPEITSCQVVPFSSQINHHACVSKQKPNNIIKKTVSSVKVNTHAVTPTSSCFPKKHHFRKASQIKQEEIIQSKISQLSTSLRFQRMNSEFSNQKKRIQITHKRGISNYSNRI